MKRYAFLLLVILPACLFGQNVGIGTTDPREELSMIGDLQIIQPDGRYGRTGEMGTYGSEVRAIEFFYTGYAVDTVFAKIGIKNYNTAGTGWYSSIDRIDAGMSFYVTQNAALTEAITIMHNARVGIGTTNPAQKLSVYPNTDASAEIGYAHVGNMGTAGWAGFSHVDNNGATTYALLQNSDGQTNLNAAAGQTLSFRIDNLEQVLLEADGDLAMQGNNSIKMPNNFVGVKDETVWTVDGSLYSTYLIASDFTDWMDVEVGNTVLLQTCFRFQLQGGSGNDDDVFFSFEVEGDGGCASTGFDIYLLGTGLLEGYEEFRDDYMTQSFQDYLEVPCTGRVRFALKANPNYTDDDVRVDRVILTGIKF